MNLTKEQIESVSLGFQWNPDMDFEQFAKSNLRINQADKLEIFNEIEQRYMTLKYENE